MEVQSGLSIVQAVIALVGLLLTGLGILWGALAFIFKAITSVRSELHEKINHVDSTARDRHDSAVSENFGAHDRLRDEIRDTRKDFAAKVDSLRRESGESDRRIHARIDTLCLKQRDSDNA